MKVITFEEYINLIPEETKQFVKNLLSYLYNKDSIKVLGDNIYMDREINFYKALKAYKKIGEKQSSILTTLTFKESDNVEGNSLSSSTMAKVFSENYEIFNLVNSKEDYSTLTPEDIIINLIKIIKKYGDNADVYVCLSTSISEFTKELFKINQEKKQLIINKLKTNLNKDLPISIINYYETVGKMYLYLKSKTSIKIIEQTNDEDLLSTSMLLALFYFQHVSQYGNNYNEQQIIIEYLSKKGITKEKILQILSIEINPEELNRINPTAVLDLYFKSIYPSNYSRDSVTIGNIIQKLFKSNYNNSIALKKIFSELNLTLSSIGNIEELLNNKKSEINTTKIEELYENLTPEVIKYLKHLSKIYQYITSKKDQLDKTIITNEKDIILLSILISSYDYNIPYTNYLIDNKLTLDELLEQIGLSKEEYLKKIETIPENERIIVKFQDYVLKGRNQTIQKINITKEHIILNSTNKSFTESSLIHRLFASLSTISLKDDFKSQMDDYFKTKEKSRKELLTEEVLSNISIDVFNYLKVVSSYYQILSNKELNKYDLEQFSIIYAASRYDKNIEEYLNSFGMTRNDITDQLKISFNYQDKPFDIDIINTVLRPYIFDRKPEEITIYTIFENAFKKELTNTINLRRVLYKYEKKPEDFLDIQTKLQTYIEEKEAKKEQDKIIERYSRLPEESKELFDLIIIIHEYLLKQKELKLIKNKDDIKELSILIAILIINKEYTYFLNRNGITLEEVINYIGLNPNIKEELKYLTPNRKIIFEYQEYIGSYQSDNTISIIINRLFDNSINKSQVIETITNLTGNNYDYLKEEMNSKKERDLTPEQGIVLLTKEEVDTIEDPSYTTISTYGQSVSKHAKYISTALQELIRSDSIEQTVTSINTLLGEVSYTETAPDTEKPSFFSLLFKKPEPPRTIKKINIEKLEDVQDLIDDNALVLQTELKKYEFIKKYIELYLIKLTEYLKRLKECYEQIELEDQTLNQEDILSFTKTLDHNSIKEILRNKINTFETIIILMKQELLTVHRAIITHFMTINSLQTSKSAILPLIAAETVVNRGEQSEKDALELTTNLLSLLKTVINKNVEGTQENLELLKDTNLSEEQIAIIQKNIDSFINTLNRSNQLLNPTTDDEPPKLLKQ